MLAVIPYTTFPTIDLGPLNLRTFGLMVALGVLLGSWVAAMYIERYGIPRDETYRVATYMVLAGIVGARLTWAATHTDQIHSLVDVIAIWEGGIQFSGGFIFALLVGLPFFRRWNRLQRWHVLDGYSLGLALGLAIGRIGCYAVGEHFGRTSSFFLATRYDGGDVREPNLGDQPLLVGTSFHNTALYEMLYMFLLFAILGGMVLLARRRGRELATGHHRRDLPALLRHRPLPERLAAGQRRAHRGADRCAVDVHRDDPGRAVDPVAGAPEPGGGRGGGRGGRGSRGGGRGSRGSRGRSGGGGERDRGGRRARAGAR